jgi:DNA-binding transcriptional MerR regulator
MTATAKRGTGPAPPSGPAGGAPSAGAREGAAASQVLAIGDLAREFGISTRAIRFYEARGLLRPVRRGTARIFGAGDRHRLALIVRAKNLGLTLAEIGEHLALYEAAPASAGEAAALRRRAARHIATLMGKRRDLHTTLKDLREIQARLAKYTPRVSSA